MGIPGGIWFQPEVEPLDLKREDVAFMLGAYYTGKPELELREIPIPDPKAGEVLVKVDTATVCGTDVHIVSGEYFSRPPVILGHEFSGTVAAVGKGVSRVKPGQLVTVEPHEYCRSCRYCRSGKEHLCTEKHAFGSYYDGGFAQYAALPEYTLYPVPEGVSPEEAALAEVTGCCIHGVDRSQIKSGDVAVVLGGSAVGIIFAKLLKRAGAASVIVSEPNPERREAALRFGADSAYAPEELQQAVMELTGGHGADVVVECTGIPPVLGQGIGLACKGGVIVVFGVAPPGKTVPLEPNLIFQKELTILGSNINPYTHRRAVEMLGVLELRELITHTFPLSGINEAISSLRNGIGLKIAVKPNALV